MPLQRGLASADIPISEGRCTKIGISFDESSFGGGTGGLRSSDCQRLGRSSNPKPADKPSSYPIHQVPFDPRSHAKNCFFSTEEHGGTRRTAFLSAEGHGELLFCPRRARRTAFSTKGHEETRRTPFFRGGRGGTRRTPEAYWFFFAQLRRPSMMAADRPLCDQPQFAPGSRCSNKGQRARRSSSTANVCGYVSQCRTKPWTKTDCSSIGIILT